MSDKTHEINELLNGIAKLYSWDKKLNALRILEALDKLCDIETKRNIEDAYLRGDILYVKMKNAAARSNMSYRLEWIKEAICENLGESLILKEIVLL